MKAKTGGKLTGQEGFSLIEVLIVAIILGISVVGLSLMLSRGQAFIAGQGDTRVALHLAQQKIERLTALGFSAAIIGDRTNGDGVINGCTVVSTNLEPCYNETFSPANATPNGLGLGQQTPAATQVDTQTFTRLTCVRYVQDDNPELPADPLEPPSSWTCPSCAAAVFDPDTGACTANCTCTQQTKRIKVAVIPTLLGNAGAATPLDPNRVTLEAVVTPIPRP